MGTVRLALRGASALIYCCHVLLSTCKLQVHKLDEGRQKLVMIIKCLLSRIRIKSDIPSP